jgi:micrococcal nuclease
VPIVVNILRFGKQVTFPRRLCIKSFMASKRKTRKRPYAMSRQKRNFILAFVVLLLALITVLDRAVHNAQRESAPAVANLSNPVDFQKYHGRTFMVVKVVDGDTVDINVPDANYPHTRIRLWGVDTPETQKSPGGEMYFGKEASEFTRQLTLGKTVTVYLDQGNRTRGKYGRLLAYVQLSDGQYLNELLLTEGYAYADLRFDHSFYNKYKQLESSARSLKKGLWREVTREQLPLWLQKEKPNLLSK